MLISSGFFNFLWRLHWIYLIDILKNMIFSLVYFKSWQTNLNKQPNGFGHPLNLQNLKCWDIDVDGTIVHETDERKMTRSGGKIASINCEKLSWFAESPPNKPFIKYKILCSSTFCRRGNAPHTSMNYSFTTAMYSTLYLWESRHIQFHNSVHTFTHTTAITQ